MCVHMFMHVCASESYPDSKDRRIENIEEIKIDDNNFKKDRRNRWN